MKEVRGCRKTLSLMTALMLTGACFLPAGAAPAETIAPASKIDATLAEKMETLAEGETLDVLVWMRDIDEKTVEEEAQERAAAEPMHLASEENIEGDPALSAVQQKISIKRDVAAEQYEENNTALYNQLFPAMRRTLFRTIEQKQPEIVFQSKLSPVFIMKLTASQVNELSKSSLVEALYYEPSYTSEGDCSDTAFPTTQVDYVRDTLGFSGSGIRIGQIETSLPVRTSSTLKNSTVELYPVPDVYKQVTQIKEAHATQVATLLVGNTSNYKGIVPNASLYSVCPYPGFTWKAAIEWLLLDCKVNIINISYQFMGVDDYQTYGAAAKWLDHIAIMHDVHVVQASGNDGPGKVGSGCMAYNIITVGSVDDKNSLILSDDTTVSSSSYCTSNTMAYKPDLSAPGQNIWTPYTTNSGTSFAAPMVTGALAQLCQMNAAILGNQALGKALLMAGTTERVSGANFTSSYTAMSREIGSGVLNAKNSRYCTSSVRYRAATFVNDTSYTINFNVTSGDSLIRVALAWLKNNRFTSTDHSGSPTDMGLSRLSLYIYDPNGNFVASGNFQYGNTQVVQFTPTKTGTYKIVINKASSVDKTHFAVAWY